MSNASKEVDRIRFGVLGGISKKISTPFGRASKSWKSSALLLLF
jgi:hypothetical protein